MRISAVRIRNFRGIESLDLELGRVTVLIGENNCGKTTVLDALKLCLRDLGFRRGAVFDGLDFHLSDGAAEPSSADPIEIEVRFSDADDEEWSDQLVGRLNRARILQVDDKGRSHVRLRVTCEYDPHTREIVPDWSFLDLNGSPLSKGRGRALAVLQSQVRYHYLTALRDAARHFDAKGPFWKPFLQDSELSGKDKDEIEAKLQNVNKLVVRSHSSFEKVRDGLSQVQSVVPLGTGDAVSIEAVPNRMFETLAKAQVQLGTSTGARIPLGRHGEGTQSLAVLMLFAAFLESRPEGAAVLALEEPEAHLHPSAIRALWELLRSFGGQKLVSTHSGELLADIDVRDIRRLARTRKGIEGFRMPSGLLSEKETLNFNYHMRQARGDLLFARCWLLAEGKTEIWVYPAAARARGLNLHRMGICVVESSQLDISMLIKVANALGIDWYCVGDDDSHREKIEPTLMANLAGAEAADRFAFPYPNIEVNLLRNRYDGVYGTFMTQTTLNQLTTVPGDPGYWEEYAAKLPKRYKAQAAAAVAVEMEARGESGVTPEIRAVLEKTVALAKSDRQ